MIRLEFGNTCDIGNILFSNGFRPIVYLDQEIGYPQYPIEKEMETDGDKQENAMWQKWQKRYSLTIIGDEPYLDGITVIQLCDDVWITNPVTNIEYKIKDIVFDEVSWNEDDGLGTVKINYSISEIIVSNCCQNMTEECENCAVNITSFTYIGSNTFRATWTTTCTVGYLQIYMSYEGGAYSLEFSGTDLTNLSEDITYGDGTAGRYAVKVVIGTISCNNEDIATLSIGA